jgi:hypothetical protein
MQLSQISTFGPVNTDETMLYTSSSNSSLSSVEKNILSALNSEKPSVIISLPSGFSSQDISDPIFDNIMVESNLPESNAIMALNFIENTDVVSTKSSADLVYHNSNLVNTTVPILKQNTMELGNDTAPLYVGNLKFEFSDGDDKYNSSLVNTTVPQPDGQSLQVEQGNHCISLNNTDVDYNYFKAANSTLSNLDSNAVNGIRGGFDNQFNATNAFFTEKFINRQNDNKLIDGGNGYFENGISQNGGLASSDPLYNKLDVEVLTQSSNKPLFGALKFVQDPLSVVFPPSNNTTDDSNSSTMSILLDNTDTAQVPISTSRPPTTMNETEFENLFTNGELINVGPGYTFDLVIGNVEKGGYNINNNKNNINIPVYNDDNQVSNSPTVSYNMFTMDDNNIDENLRYMREMKNNSLFDKHAFYVKNGSFLKDNNQNVNLNFNDFIVRDGVETLKVMTLGGINDLTQSGAIKVINTNNTLGDSNCRFSRTEQGPGNEDMTLVVNYSINESDHLSDVGVLSSHLETNYYVKSNITALAKSTLTKDQGLWNTEQDVKINDDSVLVFQDTPNHPLFDKNNIIEFTASGLSTEISNDKFAFIQINKFFDSINSSDESPLFQTANNTAIHGVTSNVRLTDIDLITYAVDDLRVTLVAKKITDMPVIVKQSPNVQEWQWVTSDSASSDLVFINNSFINENDGYLISNKTSKNLLGTDIYKMMNTSNPGSDELVVTIEFVTNDTEVENRDVLERKAFVNLKLNTAIDKTVPVDENDIKIINISEVTSPGVFQSLNQLQGLDGTDMSRYLVNKFTTIKEYYACIRVKIGAYKNLWAVNKVLEETTWYQLTDINQNKILPDYYLSIIKTMDGVQAFKTKRVFKTGSEENTLVSKLTAESKFKVKDLMGFKVGLEYQKKNLSGVSVWTSFMLSPDLIYDNSLDPMFDLRTTVGLRNPTGVNNIIGQATIAIDTSITTTLGSKTDMNTDSPHMYMINLSTATGKTTFTAKGYKYNIATDSQYFNKDKTWSPYTPYTVDSGASSLFLKDVTGKEMGTEMPLSVEVTLIDPTPGDTTNVNEINQVKVTIIKNGELDSRPLASFISNKWILENFNIIANKEPIVQHDYVVSNGAPAPAPAPATEYLHSTQKVSDKFYAKLLYGNNYNGVRVEFPIATLRNDFSNFELKGDRLFMSPLENALDDVNRYSGRYSNLNGTEILPSNNGFPLPTNSTVHRNIHPTKFRGYKNDQTQITILRTLTTIKMVIGNLFQDDMNTHFDSSNIGYVWTQRGIEGIYNKLEARDIRYVTDDPSFDNLNIVPNNSGSSIGPLGLKIVPNYSMFPISISDVKHIIPITVTPANYTKTITNPLNSTINTNVSSNLFDVVLHDFKSYDIVATRIKVYNDENFNFKYEMPDLKVYHSPNYVGDVRNYTDWSQSPIQSYTDAQLRTGVVIGDQNNGGVVKFKRSLTFVSEHTKYCGLPRPIAFLEAYGITDFNDITLPANLSALTRKKFWVDINIDLPKDGQQHFPFDQNPAQTIPNKVSAVDKSLGLMGGLQLGFNVTNYLNFKYQPQEPFSFTLTSNKLKIYNGIGLSNPDALNQPYTEVFNGYISELSSRNINIWNDELRNTNNNTFTNQKKWDLNIRQLQSVLFNYITPTTLNNNYLFINGVTSYPLGTYYLDLNLLDSVVASYYSMDRSYDSENDKVNVNFYKYSSIEGINWATSEQFSKSENFRPLIVKKEKYILPVSISNVLTEERFDINELIKAKVVTELQNINTTITWVGDTSYTPSTPSPSPLRLCPLSINGSKFLHSILQVNKDFTLKIIGFTRPSLILIKSADGSTVTKISPDGMLFTVKLITQEVQLEPKITLPSGTLPNLNVEQFVGNINPSNNN